MRHQYLTLLLALGAGTAGAESYVFEFDGHITGVYGSAPSVDALGISTGTPVHYAVRVNRTRDGQTVTDGSVTISPDTWDSPEEHQDHFYAELISSAYPTPGTYDGFDTVNFLGVDYVSETFPDCEVVGRLFIGPAVFYIDGCAPVAEWSPGLVVGSAHLWHDADTDEFITVGAIMTVTSATAVPESVPLTSPLSITVLCSLLGLAARRKLRG